MPCERCVLELKGGGEIGAELFLEQFLGCHDCPNLSGEVGLENVQVLSQACKEAARLVRKLKSDIQKQKRDLNETRKEQQSINEKLLKLDRMYQNATREMEAQIEQISRQKNALRAMGTPMIRVWDRVLALPIIGTLDAERAAQMTQTLLEELAATRADLAILDLTGISHVDRATAEHLVRMAQAVRLLGAGVVLTGIQSSLARSLMELGADLSSVSVASTVKEALEARIDVYPSSGSYERFSKA